MPELLLPTPDNIQKIAAALKAGHLLGLPTETVYGLAGDASNAAAIDLIYETKGRPAFNPLIIHVANAAAAEQYGVFNNAARALASVFWPGPLTLVVPLKDGAPVANNALAGLKTIALRVPAHPLAQQVLAAFGGALAAPSANPSGLLSPTQATHVMQGFANSAEPKYVLAGGRASHGLESTIVDCTSDTPQILRLGAITAQQLGGVASLDHPSPLAGEGVERSETGEGLNAITDPSPAFLNSPDGSLKKATLSRKGRGPGPVPSITAPGQLLRHYAPRKPLRLNADNISPDEALLVFGPPPLWAKNAAVMRNLSAVGDLHEAASNLFSLLHELDQTDARAIAVVSIPDEGLGLAINDRLRRGAE